MDFTKLNKEQLKAATFNGKHLLVLAGAGTGKTRTIIARAVHLLSVGVKPERIKILSFTKKSALEIAERIKIEGMEYPCVKDISGSTFHSWCMEIIHRYGKQLGLEDFGCIDEEDRNAAIKLAIGTVYNTPSIKVADTKVSDKVISEIYSYATNTRCNLTTAIKTRFFPLEKGPKVESAVEEIRCAIAPVIKCYLQYKQSRRYIDYDDMLLTVATALQQDASLREKVSSRYDHILIDEMQDTNPLQWMLIDSFMANCHLFCVGDDAQSIYAFRGADFNSIHSFKERVPQSQVYKLETNYRSTQEILDISNWLLDKSPLNYDKKLIAHRGTGKKPVIRYVRSDWEEAEFVTSNIVDNVRAGAKYGSHMILARSAFAARKVEAACVSKKIPYVLYGGTSLMRSAHIRDVVAPLRVVSNCKDELAWVRFLMMWPGIGEATASAIIDKLLPCANMEQCIDVLRESKMKNTEAPQLLQDLLLYTTKPHNAIDLVLFRLKSMLKKKYENWEMRKRDFTALKLVASHCADITTFINEYILNPVAELSFTLHIKEEKDMVVISTIHSAKGLEAETCYILNVA
ncbi:MAG: ATP-dependent helicase, partial [Bacteroidales bacterium]|nr:ATP-dependent helicase [Bacteroidales bacterium]